MTETMSTTTATSSSTLQVGWQSFLDLSAAFSATLMGKEYHGKEPTCGTTFNLDPFAQDDNENPCVGSDWIVIGLLTVVCLTVSWGTRWLIFEPLADWRMQHVKHWNRAECRRFSMTCASCLFFVLSATFAKHILMPQPWLFDRQAWTQREMPMDADFKFFYLLYAARFLGDWVSLFFESRQVDAFVAAFVHHAVTLGLVLGSAHVGHTRYGGIIMFFFDWADIPLLCAKACKYLSHHPQDSFQYFANRLFEVFAVLFFATRCVYYNYVVYAAWMDLSNDWVNRSCQYLLLALVALQTYWMGLIVKAAVRISNNGGVAEDERDDDLKKSKKQ
jgi:TLC domain